MTDARRRAGLAQKTKPRRLITEISFADDFQCHRAVQINVERLVSDAHRTATQLDRFSIFARHQLIMLKSLSCLFPRRLDRFLDRRLTGFNTVGEGFAKHTDRTEFHRSRKLISATRAGASFLRFHKPSCPSFANRTERKIMITNPRRCLSRTIIPFHKQIHVA